MERSDIKLNIVYCQNVSEDVLGAERYIKFLKHLVKVVKEQESLMNKPMQ